MKLSRFGCIATLAFAAVGSAHAGSNVYWSVGVHAAPGVTVAAGNYAPAPVYLAPAPVYYAPPPVVYVRPAPVVYAAPVYYGGYYRTGYVGHKHKHKRKHVRYY
jgi:hypothetical protein